MRLTVAHSPKKTTRHARALRKPHDMHVPIWVSYRFYSSNFSQQPKTKFFISMQHYRQRFFYHLLNF